MAHLARVDAGRRDALEREFLPAALELLESPPSPLGRLLAAFIVTLVVSLVLWATFGHVDTVAVASGRIVPGGSVKVVQSLEMGVVRGIDVRDGDQVRAGDVLLRLDDTATAADVDRLRRELADARLEAARLRALVRRRTEIEPPAAPASMAALEEQRRLLAEVYAEQGAALLRLRQRQRETRAAAAVVEVQSARLAATLPLLEERTAALRTLADARVAARSDYLALAQELVEMQHERRAMRGRREELRAAGDALQAEQENLRAGYARVAREQAVAASRRVQALENELRKAERRHELRVLRAPVDGTVQQLAVTAAGAVVTPAEPLLTVVPNDVALEVEARISNRDAGFVQVGQVVEIKVDSFPFTRYGLLRGRVEQVAADAVPGADGSLTFPARISLDSDRFEVDGATRRISPGMRCSAEIRTGRRRLIDFFASPLMRYRHEALRER